MVIQLNYVESAKRNKVNRIDQMNEGTITGGDIK